MENALIIASSESAKTFLETFVKEAFTREITCLGSAAAARRQIADKGFEVILINTPLVDEAGQDLAVHAAQTCDSGVVLLVQSVDQEETGESVSRHGVITVSKPVHRSELAQAIRLARASYARCQSYQQRISALEDKIEEIRTVDRAKLALVMHLGMSEPAAHRYIEKQSMDRRIAKKKIAQEILSIYN